MKGGPRQDLLPTWDRGPGVHRRPRISGAFDDTPVTQPEAPICCGDFDQTGCFNCLGCLQLIFGVPACLCTLVCASLILFLFWKSALPGFVVSIFTALR